MASNKVNINSEANLVVISEPVKGSRIIKVIAAGPQGPKGDLASISEFSSSISSRVGNLENLPLTSIGGITSSVSTGSISFRVSDSTLDLLKLSSSGQLWVTGSVSASLIFGNIVSGSELIFSKLSTSQSSDSQLVIGNIFGDYSNKQTTIFKNSDVILSGSLILQEKNDVSPLEGGLIYSSSNEFYLGFS